MASRRNAYIERRDDGRYEVKHARERNPGIVRDTQREAIDAARRRYPDSHPDVERVRHTSRGKPDQWRKA
jgi:Uncharacterized protein conserved in bacteria (DUF2188)